MAKEVELKKIELRVSANCCEGCKRKVKKALRSVEGVLKTEIDPFQPKMTVLGNVNPQIIIKKLLKVGKHAELSSYEELKAEKQETTEKKEAETVAVTTEKEKEKQNNGGNQEKQSDTIENKTEKSKDITESGDGGKNKDSKKDNKEKNIAANASSNPQGMKKENFPLPPHPEVDLTNHPDMDYRVHPRIHPYSNIKTSPQDCYFAQPQPCAVAAPCYAMPSYPASPLPPICVEEYYHFDKPSYHYQSPFWRPAERVGDYFSDENTVGCHVM
ncbi:hypothetical protein L6164_004861 [Bauhinia variegata]|uniref:Uncharacterized protein n=1 Tax=Bauhinia variegata TaxID=167791 RepID=A0ACB9PPL6_BAUVA|nr:hypothetical protein L6164_004861 [Bauhinia variegata]